MQKRWAQEWGIDGSMGECVLAQCGDVVPLGARAVGGIGKSVRMGPCKELGDSTKAESR